MDEAIWARIVGRFKPVSREEDEMQRGLYMDMVDDDKDMSGTTIRLKGMGNVRKVAPLLQAAICLCHNLSGN